MIEQFVKDMLKETDLPANTDPAVYDRLVKTLTERATRMTEKKVIDSLSDEKFNEFEKLVESNTDEKALQEFITANVPNQERLIALALNEFRGLYLAQA